MEGLVVLYETNAILAIENGKIVIGHEAIRNFYIELLSSHPKFEPGNQSPALQNGNIALTSSRLNSGDVTAEIARQQLDGTWRWAVDQPSIGK